MQVPRPGRVPPASQVTDSEPPGGGVELKVELL
jgi:hypothetical protein